MGCLMISDLKLRPLKLRRDFDKLVSLLDVVFAEEISGRGMDIRQELSQYKTLMPLIKVFSLFSKTFRYSFEGFVYENPAGELIASVNIVNLYNKWEIGMVATHPDYRRKGLARNLVNKTIQYAKKNDAKICTLDVLAENEPAYRLYRSLGFTHYDSSTELKLSPEKLKKLTLLEPIFPEGYELTKMKSNKENREAYYELALRETPEAVQTFSPVDKRSYQDSKIKHILRPIAKKIIHVSPMKWGIKRNSELVGVIDLMVSRTKRNTHRLTLIINPIHTKLIAEPMLVYALYQLKKSDPMETNLLMTVRSSDEDILSHLREFHFEEIEHSHILGLRL